MEFFEGAARTAFNPDWSSVRRDALARSRAFNVDRLWLRASPAWIAEVNRAANSCDGGDPAKEAIAEARAFSAASSAFKSPLSEAARAS